jgi:hypothetical protein
MLVSSVLTGAAAASPPAGGAAVGQVIGASVAAGVLTAALALLGLGHRAGRIGVLGRVAGYASRLGGLPGWTALPSAVATCSLLSAVFGLYWDVSLHIDNGRDPGPLANPAHYFILVGLFGIFTAGWLAICLPDGRPGPAAVRLTREWHAPVSGVLLMACASFALLGFPLDDISHRLFGQDVTLWGPTHLMMLGGAAMSLIGVLGLLVEGRLAFRTAGTPRRAAPDGVLGSRTVRLVSGCGGLLVGLSIFQGEFDFGVPQFRLLFQPVLIALAAAIALVVARLLAGRGGALGAVGFFLVLRGTLTLLVGPVLGESIAHFPLYVAEGLLVEGLALAMTPARAPYRFGAVAGALAGSAGVLAEWGWSHVWMPLPWPGHIVPEAIALAVPMGVAGGVLGAFAGGALRLRPDVAATPRAWAGVATSLAVIAGVTAFLLPTTVPAGGATVTLGDVHPGHDRTARATVRFDPPDLARDADWLQSTSWQGRRRLVVQPLRAAGDGTWTTTVPLPVSGTWKTSIRLHRGSVMASIPVYFPADPAIPARAIPARPAFHRAFVADRRLLQRERKRDVPGWLWGTAGAVVLGISLLLLVLLGWGLVRLAVAGAGTAPGPAGIPATATAPRPVTGVV